MSALQRFTVVIVLCLDACLINDLFAHLLQTCKLLLAGFLFTSTNGGEPSSSGNHGQGPGGISGGNPGGDPGNNTLVICNSPEDKKRKQQEKNHRAYLRRKERLENDPVKRKQHLSKKNMQMKNLRGNIKKYPDVYQEQRKNDRIYKKEMSDKKAHDNPIK